MLSIIPCAEDCVYQKDGYCCLEMPTLVTNNTGKGCVHKLELTGKTETPPRSKTALRRPIAPPPQMLL